MTRIVAILVWAVIASGCAHSSVSMLNLGSMPNGVTMDAQVNYYDVSAASLGELRRAMLVLGPRADGRPWTAVTQTNFRWTYRFERMNAGCLLREARLELRTKITFPRWNPTAEPDSVALDWWHQMNTGLMEHERGHALISVRAAGEIRRDIEGISAATCDLVATLASARANRRITQQRQEQAAYDLTTRHGATQIEQAGRLRHP